MPFAIGIDLGTVYSCVGVYRDGNVEIIANSQGNRVTPSVVAFTDRGELTGDAAKNQIELNSKNTLYDAKRVLGRKFKDVSEYDKRRWPFKIINEDGSPMFETFQANMEKLVTPEEVSSMVLEELISAAEEYLGDDVSDVVITIPAHFNDAQRRATKDAAEFAGLNVLRLINEPTAAAIAYGLKEKGTSGQNILVFDMGGGTFDVSILSIDGDIYDVKAVGGDTHLGGEDFNNKLLDHFMAEISQTFGIDISDDKIAISRLLKACELAKITLSTLEVAEININPLVNSFAFKSTITRVRFEELVADFFDKAINIVEDTIKQSKLQKSEIQEVLLVGGSTYIPKIQQMLQKCFAGKALNKSIKPEEAVAYGAAIYASVLSGEEIEGSDLLIFDVTPHSLGLEYGSEFFHKLIERNAQIPLEVVSDRFSTTRNNQKEVAIKIYEGEEMLTAANNLLDRFYLKGLPNAPAKKLRITIKFKIDADGILEVTAEESSSGVKKSIQVDKRSAPSSAFGILSDTEKADAKDRLLLFKQMTKLSFIEEKQDQSLHFKHGLDYFGAEQYDKAFDCLTEAIRNNNQNGEAMKLRARIHFLQHEYEECIVECEELFKLSPSHSVFTKEFIKKSKLKISPESRQKWYEVFGVARDATKSVVTKAYRQFAKKLGTNNAKSSKLLKADRKKKDAKMAKINGAKSEWERQNINLGLL